MCIWKVKEGDRLCTMCKMWGCEDRKDTRRRGHVMGLMRNMNINDELYFPVQRWGAVRSCANRLKDDYGAVYVVNKIGDEIRAKRIN